MEDTQRVLVIEDDPILRDLLTEWLLAAGYRVGVEAEGASGIENARAERPALVVTDIRMPGTSGADVISELVGAYPGIPVIAISAHFRSGHGLTPVEARSLGAARTLAKPFRRAEMVGAVRDLIGPPAA